jgi:hypothetical protein
LEPERVLIAQLLDDVLEDFAANARKSLHLRPAFGHIRVAAFGTNLLKKYIANRKTEEAANATISRELTILKRAFNLGYRAEPPLVMRVPHFPRLEENNFRTGFLEKPTLSVRDLLPEYLRLLFVLDYHHSGTACLRTSGRGQRLGDTDVRQRLRLRNRVWRRVGIPSIRAPIREAKLIRIARPKSVAVGGEEVLVTGDVFLKEAGEGNDIVCAAGQDNARAIGIASTYAPVANCTDPRSIPVCGSMPSITGNGAPVPRRSPSAPRYRSRRGLERNSKRRLVTASAVGTCSGILAVECRLFCWKPAKKKVCSCAPGSCT